MFWASTFLVVGALLVWMLRPVLAILAGSAGLAYILDPFVDWLESNGMSRDLSTGVVLLTLGAAMTISVMIRAPPRSLPRAVRPGSGDLRIMGSSSVRNR